MKVADFRIRKFFIIRAGEMISKNCALFERCSFNFPYPSYILGWFIVVCNTTYVSDVHFKSEIKLKTK